MTPFRFQRRVEFCETDLAGIVHFSNFFRFMESAEVEFLRSLGLSVKMDWAGLMIGFPRVSASCDYLSPAFFEDVIEIEVSVAKLGQKSVTYTFDFFREGKLLARGKVTSVCCCVNADHQLEAIPIPEEYRTKLTQETIS